MSRSTNSRRGSRDRHVREYLRHEVEHEQRRRERAAESEALSSVPVPAADGDCTECGWIAARETCPMCEAPTRGP